ncbi:MAG: choice-of-anchor D domain-containing protein [Bacteroidetes bacterium]|nr:choice-of-anchor D domain-containing protein [Bacteroidota bacterium]
MIQRALRILPAVLLLLSITGTRAFAQIAGSGRSFVLTVPYTSIANNYIPPRPRLLLTSTTGTTARLLYSSTGTTDVIPIAAGISEEVILDSARVMLTELPGIFRSTIQITSDAPITATLLLDRSFASEAFAAIPDSLLGFEYMAASSDATMDGDMLAVVGVHDGTTVTITPSNPTRDGHGAGVPYTVQLNRGDVYQTLTAAASNVELTGTTILADKPCAVTGGSVCADIVAGVEHTCNPLLESLPHVDAWGTHFVAGPLQRQQLALVTVIARCAGTTVHVSGDPIVLGAGQRMTALLDTIYEITASNPVLVQQFITSTSQGLQDRSQAYGDPSMATVPPFDQWTHSYRFAIPSMAPRTDAGPAVGWRHFASVMMPAADEAGVVIDGAPPVWTRRMQSGGFTIGIQEFGPGDHTVESPDSVGLLLYGYSAADAYGYTPSPVVRPYPLGALDLAQSTCHDTLDTTITFTNLAADPVSAESISLGGALTGIFTTNPALPATLPSGGKLALHLRLRNLLGGPNAGLGYVIVKGGGACGQRLGVIAVNVGANAPQVVPASGATIDFGIVPLAIPLVDRIITLSNRGTTPITVTAPVLTSPAFSVAAPAFPYVLAPGESVSIVLRFSEMTEGSYGGSVRFGISGCPDTWTYTLTAERRKRAYLTIGRPAPVRLLCAPKEPDTLRITLGNHGDVPLDFDRGLIEGTDASEFRLLDSVAGRTIAPGDSVVVRVLYTPGALGARDGGLTVESSGGSGITLNVPFDVRNDTLRLRALVNSLDFGVTNGCDALPATVLKVVNESSTTLGEIDAATTRPSSATLAYRSGPYVPGDTMQITVGMAPDARGAVSDSIRIRIPGCDSILVVPLSGVRNAVELASNTSELDFGILSFCDTMAVAHVVLRNRGDVADSVVLDRALSADFDLAPSPPVVLAPGDSMDLAVRFHPATPGARFDTVQFRSLPCNRRIAVALAGAHDAGHAVLASPGIDFDTVAVGETRTDSVRLVNHGALPCTIGSLMLGGATGGVRIVAPSPSTVVPAGDSVQVQIEYQPATLADTLNGAATVHIDSPCADSMALTLTAVLVEERTRPLLRLERISAAAGSAVNMRLTIEQGPNAVVNDTLLVRARLRFNRTLLLPVEAEGGAGIAAAITGSAFNGTDREVTLEARGLMPDTGIVAILHARAMLGDADSTALRFSDAVVERARTAAVLPLRDTVAGSFVLLGICTNGGRRLLETASAARISLREMPVRDAADVEFSALEKGRAVLLVLDGNGRAVRRLFDDEVGPGVYHAAFDSRDLASGIYWLQLINGTSTTRAGVLVEH